MVLDDRVLHSLTFIASPQETLELGDLAFGFSEIERPTFSGLLNGEDVEGALSIVEGDIGISFTFYVNAEYLVSFELAEAVLPLVQLESSYSSGETCVCWPKSAGGSCTKSDCDDSNKDCGSPGGICMYRHVGHVVPVESGKPLIP